MNIFSYYLTAILLILSFPQLNPQSRIHYNNQDLFLSGANLAWVSFAGDIGPGSTDFNSFADAFLQMHANGGNAVRWWLHTNGTSSPEFDDSGFVVGPGAGTIEDLKKVLDIAWEREIGVILCLWSFDMLRTSIGSDAINRNTKLLTDTTRRYINAYINNSLIPMVDSLKGHPAVIAWEIFNEPEGMSSEFGWPEISHVPMSDIQRFINLCTGAIHRTDTSALVTSGSWSFQAMTDAQISSIALSKQFDQLSKERQIELTNEFNQKYRLSLTYEEYKDYIEKISAAPNLNYYRDDRLIAAGQDNEGILDFYSVHYYPGLGRQYSPFTHPVSAWELDKPVVAAEFAMAQNNDNVPKDQLFLQLYQFGYAGALPWSWTDVNFSSHEDMLNGMKYMRDNFKNDVDVNGISGEWPEVAIIAPENNSEFPDSADILIQAEASDADGSIVMVEFFASDTLKIGEADTIPYTITWNDAPNGVYNLTAVATDDSGNQRVSDRVKITVGTPEFINLEAETAISSGSGFSILEDPLVSNGRFLRMRTNVGIITWILPDVPHAGNYMIKFGYRLYAGRPKNQYINVNGPRVTELVFDSTMNVWLENPLTVSLIQGRNTIQMELSWGWMDLDYMAVPTEIGTAAAVTPEIPLIYSLEQNYPNPFNPETKIRYSILRAQNVKLAVYDILGRRVSVLVDRKQNAGFHSVTFNGDGLASGVYFYKLEAENFTQVKKMMLIK